MNHPERYILKLPLNQCTGLIDILSEHQHRSHPDLIKQTAGQEFFWYSTIRGPNVTVKFSFADAKCAADFKKRFPMVEYEV